MRRILFLKKSKSLRGSSGASIEFSLLLFQPLFSSELVTYKPFPTLIFSIKIFQKFRPLVEFLHFPRRDRCPYRMTTLLSPRTPGLRTGYFLLHTSPS